MPCPRTVAARSCQPSGVPMTAPVHRSVAVFDPPWSVQRELQTHAAADGISCVVEGFGVELVGEDEHRGGEFGDGERLGTCPAAVPGQIPPDDADVRGQLLRHAAPQRRRRGAEGRAEQQQRPTLGSAEVDGGETGNAHEASLTKRRARFNVESINRSVAPV